MIRIKIDSLTALLIFFTLFLATLFVYLTKVEKDIEEHMSYHHSLIEMQFINKDFDNFLLKKSTFINYDAVNLKILHFKKEIEFLDSEYLEELLGSEYSLLIKNLKISFAEKEAFIEKFKTSNATLLHSMHYVFDLNEAIQKDVLQVQSLKNVVSKQTILLMNYYLNNYTNKNEINNNLDVLRKYLKNKHNVELELFLLHILNNIKSIENRVSLENIAYTNNSLSDSINKLHTFLSERHNTDVFIGKIITTVFFVLSFIILIILIIMHRRALTVKNELLGFKLAVENSDNSIVITDANKNITYVNDVFERETGYQKEEVLGKNPRVLKSGIMPQSVYNDLHKALDKGEKWEGEFINLRKDKSLYYEKASIIPIYINKQLKYYLAIKLNITSYIEQKEELEHLAHHDPLTSLPNRIYIEKSIEKSIQIAKRNQSKLTILFIDLDRFKIINDTLGHDIGDELLIETAKILKTSLRDTDKLARLGGDEFLVVLETLGDEYDAGKVCEKILQLFIKPIQTKEHKLNITLSIGISIFPDDGADYQTLLKHADTAMYQAKSAGKNTFRYYQKQLSIDVQRRLNIEQAFRGSIENNEFYMVYQPKYTLKDKKVVGLEVLVRWNSQSLDFIGPDAFIPIAEDTGFILELGVFIFRQACQDFLIFKEHCMDLKTISINISAVQLYQETFVSDILSIIKEFSIEPVSIMLEITETYIMKNIHHSMKVLNTLQEIGFKISIDDFGTGYSSLSYLKQFPIYELKIDKSFVDGIPDDADDIAITQVIIGLSKNLGYINIAEGIENEKQEEFLLENDCFLGQGFYFCKPKKKEDLLKFLV